MQDFEKNFVPEILWKGSRRRWYWVLTRGAIISILILSFYFLLSPVITFIGLEKFDSRNHLLATSIFSSAILTFALIAVYRDVGETQRLQATELEEQSHLQERINKIQEKQQELMEIDHKPEIVVDEWILVGNSIVFDLINVGNGPAFNIGYNLSVEEYKMGDFFEGVDDFESNEDQFNHGDVVSFRRPEQDVGRHRNYLKTGEAGEFESAALISDNSNSTSVPFSEKLSTIIEESDMDVVLIEIDLNVAFESILDDEIHTKNILNAEFEIKEDITMEELITSQPVVGYSMGRSTVLPENIDEDREEAFRREGVFRPPEDVEQNVGKKHLNHFIISAAETLDTEGFKSLFTGIVSALTESDGDAFDVEQAEELEAFFEGLDEEGWEELIYSIKNDENMVDILGED